MASRAGRVDTSAHSQSNIPDEVSSLQVQYNTRVPISTRQRLDRYLNWLNSTPLEDRPGDTSEWPRTIAAVTDAALLDFLASHQPVAKTGPRPRPSPKRTTSSKPRKKKV
jgi:hypothetical protein